MQHDLFVYSSCSSFTTILLSPFCSIWFWYWVPYKNNPEPLTSRRRCIIARREPFLWGSQAVFLHCVRVRGHTYAGKRLCPGQRSICTVQQSWELPGWHATIFCAQVSHYLTYLLFFYETSHLQCDQKNHEHLKFALKELNRTDIETFLPNESQTLVSVS